MSNQLSLAEALPLEIKRVRELLPMYDAIPMGIFAATMMRQSIAKAEQATLYGDVVGMVQAYADLKGFTG
jgi:hypothetical protein